MHSDRAAYGLPPLCLVRDRLEARRPGLVVPPGPLAVQVTPIAPVCWGVLSMATKLQMGRHGV
jgi:hypothetical protein